MCYFCSKSISIKRYCCFFDALMRQFLDKKGFFGYNVDVYQGGRQMVWSSTWSVTVEFEIRCQAGKRLHLPLFNGGTNRKPDLA